MAIETPCQTPGCEFSTIVDKYGILVRVSFPETIELSPAQADLIEKNLHNAVELVLAPYFKGKE